MRSNVRFEALIVPIRSLTRVEAALERVPEIKPQDVQEVFFGNVLSAKYGL